MNIMEVFDYYILESLICHSTLIVDLQTEFVTLVRMNMFNRLLKPFPVCTVYSIIAAQNIYSTDG